MRKCYVYLHTCPNGKEYVGISVNPQVRWQYGWGYSGNKDFWADIQRFGWEEIEHEILMECDCVSDARAEETKLIKEMNTSNPEFGYNHTHESKEKETKSARTSFLLRPSVYEQFKLAASSYGKSPSDYLDIVLQRDNERNRDRIEAERKRLQDAAAAALKK